MIDYNDTQALERHILETIPMGDVFLLYFFEIFEEENGIERVFPPSL